MLVAGALEGVPAGAAEAEAWSAEGRTGNLGGRTAEPSAARSSARAGSLLPRGSPRGGAEGRREVLVRKEGEEPGGALALGGLDAFLL